MSFRIDTSVEYRGGDVPRGLAIRSSRVTQMLDAPHYGEEDGATADDIDQVQYVSPREPLSLSRRVLGQNDDRNIR